MSFFIFSYQYHDSKFQKKVKSYTIDFSNNENILTYEIYKQKCLLTILNYPYSYLLGLFDSGCITEFSFWKTK